MGPLRLWNICGHHVAIPGTHDKRDSWQAGRADQRGSQQIDASVNIAIEPGTVHLGVARHSVSQFSTQLAHALD